MSINANGMSFAMRKRMTLAATILGSSMAFIESTVTNIALPAIKHDLDAGAAATQWFANAYLLTLGAFVLIGGSAADRFGRRRIFIWGALLFAVASIACGVASGTAALIMGRALQGCGAALLTPASLAILSATFPEGERNRAIGLWAGFGALASAAGPVIGGWLVDETSWRAIFLINVPLAAGAIFLAVLFIDESRNPLAGSLDWKGAVLAAIGIALSAWGLSEIPVSGFLNPEVLIRLISGGCFLAAFLLVEAKAGNDAMMPLSFFRSRRFVGTSTLTLLLYFALGGLLYFLPFGLIRIGGYTATQSGGVLLPVVLMLGFGSPAAGVLADYWGARISLTTGPLLAAAGLAMIGFADLSSPYFVSLFPPAVVLGVGMTVTVAPLTSVVMAALGSEYAGTASGINNATARLAGLFAVALLGTVLFAAFKAGLSSDDIKTAASTLDALMSGQAPISSGSERLAFGTAYRTVIFACAGSAALGGLVAWLTIEPSTKRVE